MGSLRRRSRSRFGDLTGPRYQFAREMSRAHMDDALRDPGFCNLCKSPAAGVMRHRLSKELNDRLGNDRNYTTMFVTLCERCKDMADISDRLDELARRDVIGGNAMIYDLGNLAE